MIGFVAILLFAPQQPAPAPPPEDAAQLLAIKRVYVDRLTGGDSAAQLRDLIIASLQNTRLFVITENQDRADAIIRGAAEDLVFTDTFASSDGVNANAGIGLGTATGSSSRSGSRYLHAGAGDHESTDIKERKHEALATVRLVNKDGDVIWSTTQESFGGKFRGASADVADKIAKQLLADADRARKGVTAIPARP
jgi:hypothetical protein